ncbi:MAG: Hsp20/alpha crystallin family protein [Cyanobacteria bacterium J06554_6]
MSTLTRWNPWREMNSLQRQMNRMFEDALAPVAEEFNPLERLNSFTPAVEMTESDEAVDVKLELPGLSPDDVSIEVSDRAVSISGERKSEKTAEENGVTRSEFYYGSFRRVIPLSAKVQNTDARADYQDGILHLTLPKAAEERNKVVKVDINR